MRGTLGKTTGKWYTEFKIIQVESGWSGGAAPVVGICSERTDLTNPYNNGPDEVLVYSNAPSNCVVFYGVGKSINYGTFFTTGATVGVALDLVNNTVQFYIGTTPYATLSLATYSNVGHTFYPLCGSPYATGTNGIVDLISTGSLLNPIPSGFSRW
ncbi:hypothetical protein [Ralstonia phage RSF1]|uniref:B30.2/SPRY domain-containing protein n=1 Tax=Ralstonia phage RSF1 TaxID=1689679 RepID=A0A0K2QR02_9CAUD|nr:hypothetical protein AVU11_agp38 [Ralstonia phage RSF1]BAS04983.2 hypothetical protein [Ralstonia phage RSF1]